MGSQKNKDDQIMHRKHLKQTLRKVELDREKRRKIERMQLLQFTEMEDLNLLPLEPETKNQPLFKWKKYEQEKIPKTKWNEWFIEKDYNIAVICGETSGNLVIVDCDKPKLAQKIFGNDIKDRTFVVETGGDPKGRNQVYFKTDYPVEGRKFHDIRVEILGRKNYGIFPSSTHPLTGRKYKPLKMTPIAHIDGDFYEELFDLLSHALGKTFKPEKYKRTINIDELLQGVKHGQRDEAAIRIVNWLRQGEAKEEEAEAFMLEWNERNYVIDETGKRTSDPLPENTIIDKVSRCYVKPEPYAYKFNRRYVPESAYPKEIIEKAEKILAEGDPFEAVNKAVSLLHAGDEDLIRIEWLSVLSSRLAPKIKANLWQIGKSQSGKSHSMYSTLHAVPKEYYEIFTSSSPLSFFYYIKKYGEWGLDKKLIYIDEVEASKRALPMLRTLTGQTDITPRHLSVFEGDVLDLKIKGKRSVWFTSVETFGKDQIKNRFMHINPDETEEQDERVFDLQTQEYWENVETDEEPLLIMQAMTQKIVKETAGLKVKKPFKPVWPFKKRRWLFPIFATFVDTIAKIMYKQRKMEDGYIRAQAEDVETAKRLWQTYQKSIIYRVSKSALTVYEVLPHDKDDAMSFVEIAEQTGMSTEWARTHCKELAQEGLASYRKRAGRGAPWEYWKVQPLDMKAVGIKSSAGSQMLNYHHLYYKLPTKKKIKNRFLKNSRKMLGMLERQRPAGKTEKRRKTKKKLKMEKTILQMLLNGNMERIKRSDDVGKK